MQTERVTFLTTPDHKAALDAFATSNGRSVGHVLREASSLYIAPPRADADQEAELAALTDELETALPEMRDDFAASLEELRAMNAMIEAYRAEKTDAKTAA